MSLGQNICILRKRLGLTQGELAKKAKASTPERIRIGTSHVSGIENGIKFPSHHVLAAIAKALDTTVSKLTGSCQVPKEVILDDAQQKAVDHIIEATRGGPTQDWVERIADIAHRAQLPLEKICWQGSPYSVATNVVTFAVCDGEFYGLKKTLERLLG